VIAEEQHSMVSVVIVGAGPAGLAAAVTLKKHHPDLDICVLDAAAAGGESPCSGAVVEPEPLEQLLDLTDTSWRESEQGQNILGRQVIKDDLVTPLGQKSTLRLNGLVSLAKVLGMRLGRLTYRDSYIVSAGELRDWLYQIAVTRGVEFRWGCRAEQIIMDSSGDLAAAVEFLDHQAEQPDSGEATRPVRQRIDTEVVILAEGCKGGVTEDFVRKNSLRRHSDPVYALSLTELIEVQSQQYEKLGNNRIVNVLGSGLSGLRGNDCMSGSAVIYPMGQNKIALRLIVAANADDGDGRRQELFERVKRQKFVRQFVEGGKVLEASSRMIPARGFYALPRNPLTGAIGKSNVLITGDSAGFVNVLKGTSLPHALASGWAAGMAVAQTLLSDSERIAEKYSEILELLPLYRQMYALRHVRGVKPRG